MSKKIAIEQAVLNFIIEKRYTGSEDDLKKSAVWHPRFFKKCYYVVHIEGMVDDIIIKETYRIIEKESISESTEFLCFISVYLLLAIAFVVGMISNNHYLELAYFSPMLLGYFYFKMTHKHLGSLLKKQADTISFFLSMITVSYLQLKVMGYSLFFFPIFDKSVTYFFICMTLHLLTIFVSVKFYISALDWLDSTEKKGRFLQWIHNLLS